MICKPASLMSNTVVITGASKGFGRAVAKAFARCLDGSIHFVLSGRSQPELSTLLTELTDKSEPSRNISSEIIIGDVSQPHELTNLAERLFKKDSLLRAGATTETNIYFVNNAGSLGPLTNVGNSAQSAMEITNVINTNITSCFFLTSHFVKSIEDIASTMAPSMIRSVHLVNVSSITAVLPCVTMSLYCAGKAARDMYHAVLAEEQKKKHASSSQPYTPISVLNYAPGPMDTNMQATIREAEAADPTLGTVYTDMKTEGKLVDCEVSAEKMVKILSTVNAYESGAHIDYFDEVPGLQL